MFKKIINLFFLFIVIMIDAVDIGSDTAVTRFNATQVLQNGDRVAGFAALDGGLTLANASVTGIWDSFFPLSGDISLQTGTLSLNKDLVVRDTYSIVSLGSILGNGYALNILGSSSQVIPTLVSSCALTPITFYTTAGTNVISDWSFDGNYVAGTTSSGTGGVFVLTWDGSNLAASAALTALGGFGAPTIASCRWHPDELWIALVRDEPIFFGDGIFVISYNPGGPSLTVLSSNRRAAFFGTSTITTCAWHPSGDYLAVGSAIGGSEILIYPVDGAGNLGTASTFAITPARTPQRNGMAWNGDGTYLAVGVNHTGANPDILVYEFTTGPVNLTLNASAVVETGVDVLSIAWNPDASFDNYLALGIGAGFTDSVQLYEHNSGAGTLTKQGGISDLNSVAVQAVDWSFDGECLGVGRDVFSGAGAVLTYGFDNLTFDLSFNFDTTTNVTSFRYSPNGLYQINSQDGATTIINAFQRFIPIEGAVTWNNLKFLMQSDLIFQQGIIVFSGDCLINGRSGRLIIDPTCSFIVDSNSGLTFKDVTLIGINNDTLGLSDNTGHIIFDNVRMILDDVYSFSLGYFEVNNQLTIDGDGYNFNYQTDLQSTITSDAQLIIGEGVVFNYAPSVSSKTLLRLYDDTSSIMLNGGTLATSDVGIQLTKGTLFIEGKSFLSNAGTMEGKAIEFGDGTNTENNLVLEWLPAAVLELQQGFVRDRNV